MSATGTHGVDPGIVIGRRLHVLVDEQFTDAFMGSWIFIQDDFRSEVSELMRR